MRTSAVEFSPEYPAGSDDRVCRWVSPPSLSHRNAMIVEAISPITYANAPSGVNARWRGPAPGADAASEMRVRRAGPCSTR